LKTVNRALMERLVKKHLRFTDAERRKLAVLGKKLGRKALTEVATIATPDTILRWYRDLVAKKYDGSSRRGPGRPRASARDRASAGRDGNAEHRLGLRPAPRRAQERWIRSRSEHDQEDLEGAGNRAGAAATAAVLVGDVHQSAPECDHRRRLLYGRGAELGRDRPLPRLLSDRPRDSTRGDRRHLEVPRRLVDGAGGAEPARRRGRLPAWQAIPDPGPRPVVHARVPSSDETGWGGGSAVAAEQPELERLRGEVRVFDQERMPRSDRAAGRGALPPRRQSRFRTQTAAGRHHAGQDPRP
jgi:hypothetical protein